VVGRQLNAGLSEWMMGLPAGWVTEVLPNRKALRVIGNGVVPQQARLALELLDP
jgi:DNA (cytosine-5)-methyltransferase 1